MTIMHKLGDQGLQRPKYKCDVCGHVDFWDEKTWSRFSSINHDETCPNDVPTACSPECADVIDKKIKSKEWQLPKLDCSNYYCSVSKERVGY